MCSACPSHAGGPIWRSLFLESVYSAIKQLDEVNKRYNLHSQKDKGFKKNQDRQPVFRKKWIPVTTIVTNKFYCLRFPL